MNKLDEGPDESDVRDEIDDLDDALFAVVAKYNFKQLAVIYYERDGSYEAVVCFHEAGAPGISRKAMRLRDAISGAALEALKRFPPEPKGNGRVSADTLSKLVDIIRKA